MTHGFYLSYVLVGVLLLAAPGVQSVEGQTRTPPVAESAFVTPAYVAPAPFGPGERALYQVKLGGVSVGKGSMHVLGTESVHGFPTYHTQLKVAGGIPFARVDDTFESWIDVGGLFSRRFKQDQKEVSFKRKRTYEFFPEQRSLVRVDNGDTAELHDQPTAG